MGNKRTLQIFGLPNTVSKVEPFVLDDRIAVGLRAERAKSRVDLYLLRTGPLGGQALSGHPEISGVDRHVMLLRVVDPLHQGTEPLVRDTGQGRVRHLTKPRD